MRRPPPLQKHAEYLIEVHTRHNQSCEAASSIMMASSKQSPSAAAHPAAASQTQLRRSSRIASKATTAAAAAAQPKTVSQSSTSSTDKELKNVFYLFPQLPIEIRLMIWALALPGPRLVCLEPRFFSDMMITKMRRDPSRFISLVKPTTI